MHDSILTPAERAMLLGVATSPAPNSSSGTDGAELSAAAEPLSRGRLADREWSSEGRPRWSDEPAGHRSPTSLPSNPPIACTRAQWDGARRYFVRLERPLAEVLRTIVRTKVAVRLVRLEQLTFGQLQLECPAPTCFAVFALAGLDERCGWDVGIPLVRTMVERWLGGGGATLEDAPSGLTEIESRLATRLLQTLAAVAARHTPGPVAKSWELEQQVARPDRLRVWTAGRPMAMAEFEVVIGNCDGTMRLALPLELLGQLTVDAAHEGPGLGVTGTRGQSGDTGPSELVVSLLPTAISLADVESLQVGDIVLTDHLVGQPLLAELAGEMPLRVELATADGQLVVRRTV